MNNCFNCRHFNEDMEEPPSSRTCHLRDSCWGNDLIRGHYWEREVNKNVVAVILPDWRV